MLYVQKVGPYGQKLLREMKKGEGSRNAAKVGKRQ